MKFNGWGHVDHGAFALAVRDMQTVELYDLLLFFWGAERGIAYQLWREQPSFAKKVLGTQIWDAALREYNAQLWDDALRNHKRHD